MRLVKIILNLAKKMKKELLSSTKRATIFDIIRASFMVSRATFFDKKSYFFIVFHKRVTGVAGVLEIS